MERATEVVIVDSEEHIPSNEFISSIPREKLLKLLFKSPVLQYREAIGNRLKDELTGFQISIHTIEPEINIAKLITDQEIEEHQAFFEQCAKDYRALGEKLIFRLAKKLNIELYKDFPLGTFWGLNMPSGKMGEWQYYVHGFHCCFENKVTHQIIEVPLVFSYEFGDLDPYFFTGFIKSTSSYYPLPVAIYDNYADGLKILDKMFSLGKFEKIPSNVGNHFGIVVADREKVEITPYKEENFKSKKPKFNLWRFLGLK
ncbi:DUF6896 domain-containing protein [Adhaeribacter pallidiroseus]|uniref:DUF6896 domain-containing protein n=1 Tax=Adhaeribacter pallidiroseus TaxID=2072847 RepID=A0A369QR79_9BACT|nr:hypothetical protein [Adhaeribacter pallidiroseus]RDC66175.1 hypothetical protein AHMF7616_04806 [Adhaeribacter pallidiroseus]